MLTDSEKRIRLAKAAVRDRGWVGYVLTPTPYRMIVDSSGSLDIQAPSGTPEAPATVTTNKAGKELQIIAGENVDGMMLELFESYGKLLNIAPEKIFLDHLDFGLFVEFNDQVGDDIIAAFLENGGEPITVATARIVAFFDNIAEYQAKRVADECGIRSWFCTKAYHDEGARYPTDTDNMHFVPSNVTHIHPGFGEYWKQSPDLQSWMDAYYHRCPGLIMQTNGARRIAQALKAKRFQHLEGYELMMRVSQFLKAQASQNRTMLDIAKSLGVAETSDEMSLNYFLPQKETA